ncbi:flavin reductase family protein [Nocardia altamirensis]|uniref:flavin reductase family protein n=1 Tax=Nocardia altamirensis TaxID=472158 RepID=UPI00084008F1|nr:flavin reductase family protein [Nocardia altamirensis]
MTGQQQYDTSDFRQFMSSFPSGVAVVTSVLPDGCPTGFTCTSLCSVSMDPPTLLVCANQAGRSGAAVVASGGFAVNLLHVGATAVAKLFAAPTSARFRSVEWHRTPNGMPALTSDAFAVADCKVVGHLQIETHTVIFGRPIQITHSDAAGRPLLYGMRMFNGWNTATQYH